MNDATLKTLSELDLEGQRRALQEIGAFRFIFDGVNSKEYGLYATLSNRPFNTPKRPARKKIDFRPGEHTFKTGMHKSQYLTMECFWLEPKTRHHLREVAGWLDKQGRLTLDFESDKHYRDAVVDERSELDTLINRSLGGIMLNGKFYLDWYLADPYAYSEQTVKSVSAGHTDINYKGTAPTPTLIILRNTTSQPIRGVEVTSLALF